MNVISLLVVLLTMIVLAAISAIVVIYIENRCDNQRRKVFGICLTIIVYMLIMLWIQCRVLTTLK